MITNPLLAKNLSFTRRYTFMGRRGCIVGEVELASCRVPADHLIGHAAHYAKWQGAEARELIAYARDL